MMARTKISSAASPVPAPSADLRSLYNPEGDETEASPSLRSALRITWSRLLRSKTAVLGLILVCCLCAVAVLADRLAPYSPYAVHVDASLTPPSQAHPLGTDLLGRDVLSRILHGSRISLYVGLTSILLALLVGVPLGLLTGFCGGKLDLITMRFMDIILAFPFYLQAIVIMVILGPGVTNVILALGIERVPIFARLVRGSVLSVREYPYIEATNALALSLPRVLVRHVLPNCLAPIIVAATLSTATAIIVEATLSFLGLGTQPPTASWGWDLKQNLTFLEINAWIAIFPGLSIFLTVLGFNLLGDGLRDALDPRLKP
jgi:peptide/nickel transport system permease protein